MKSIYKQTIKKVLKEFAYLLLLEKLIYEQLVTF